MSSENNLVATNPQNSKAMRKYLAQYLDPVATRAISELGTIPIFQAAVVVPCYRDRAMLTQCLQHLAEAAKYSGIKALAILVVNAKHGDNPEAREENKKTLIDLGLHAPMPLAAIVSYNSHLHVIAINCNESPFLFSANEGVGRARKIGCDLALLLHERNRFDTEWLFNTDCDTVVAKDYFKIDSYLSKECVGVIKRFRHVRSPYSTDDSWLALQLYELWLRYYNCGLRYASSPYAYQSLGSTMQFRMEAYAKVRGFPQRLAGEDFHFWNKLAKIGHIEHRSAAEPVHIMDRPSTRVPFGTSVSTQKIVAQKSSLNVMHPSCFTALKKILSQLKSHVAVNELVERLNEFLPAEKRIAEELITHIGLEDFLALQQTRRTAKERAHHLFIWFDALKTLRTLHWIRDHIYGQLELREAIGRAEFLPIDCRHARTIEQQLAAIRSYEEATTQQALWSQP